MTIPTNSLQGMTCSISGAVNYYAVQTFSNISMPLVRAAYISNQVDLIKMTESELTARHWKYLYTLAKNPITYK